MTGKKHTLAAFPAPPVLPALLIALTLFAAGAGRAQETASPAVPAETTPAVPVADEETPAANEETPAVPARDDLKVVFDETTPGVMIVESNGRRFRIDANARTVVPLGEVPAAGTTAGEPPPMTDGAADEETRPETDEALAGTPQDIEEEESIWDFEKGEEPYDYRIVSVPTPKSVPKGSWNLWFSHRFSQPIHPLSQSAKNLLGFDSFSVSSFGVAYGITDKLYVNAARSPLCRRGLCRTIEVGLGYNWLSQEKDSPFALTTYASVEGDENFTKRYTFNLQTMLSHRVGERVYLFFSPAVHINSNGQGRFNPRPNDFFPPAPVADDFKLPKHTVSYGFGTTVLITHDLAALFDFTPRTGFKLGRVRPLFDQNFNIVGFENSSQPTIGFGIQKNIGNHSFTLTFSNSQTTTTSRYNSSNLVLPPKRLIIGFNLFRRL